MVWSLVVDALHELLDAGERASANGSAGDHREEAFDLIEPGACEVGLVTPSQDFEPFGNRTTDMMDTPNWGQEIML